MPATLARPTRASEATATVRGAAAVALGLVALAAAPAHAEDGAFSLGLRAGTLGLGLEAGWRVNEHFGLRLDGATYDYSRTEDVDDVEYDAELGLESYGATLDWYPAGGGFRFSAGARANDNAIDLDAAPTTNVTLGGATFTPAQVGRLTGRLETDSFAPTLTLGWGGALAPGFTLGLDVGVMWQGSPTIENLRSTGGVLSGRPELEARLRAEEAEIEDELEEYRLWPVLQLSFAWRF